MKAWKLILIGAVVGGALYLAAAWVWIGYIERRP